MSEKIQDSPPLKGMDDVKLEYGDGHKHAADAAPDELVTVEAGFDANEVITELSHEEGLRALRKCDYRLIPLLGLLYLVAFVDRSNIGNAKIAGMTEDLGLHGLQYNIAVCLL